MAKRGEQKAKVDREEEEVQELKSVIEATNGDDDVEKAMVKRAAKLVESDSDGVVLDGNDHKVRDDSGVVSVSGGGVGELAALSAIENEAVLAAPSGIKKRRNEEEGIQKSEIKEQTIFSASCEEKAETIEKPETVEKSEAVEAAEVVEPLDLNGVEISDKIVPQKLLRGSRYFDPPDIGWTACYNCGEEGHMTVNCTLLIKKKKPCFICGGLDHSPKQCQKGRDCYICESSGHSAKDCPENYEGTLKSCKICLKCGDSGHDMFSCRNNYSLDDLKEIQCYMCKSFGHLCCAKFVDDSPRQISCYRCGKVGHTGSACRRLSSLRSSCYKCGKRHFARKHATSRSLALTYTEQEIEHWREERRKNYPSKENIEKKQAQKLANSEIIEREVVLHCEEYHHAICQSQNKKNGSFRSKYEKRGRYNFKNQACRQQNFKEKDAYNDSSFNKRKLTRGS